MNVEVKEDVGVWATSMKIRFYNLDDACCSMGKSLRPVENLCRAVEMIEYYREKLAAVSMRKGVVLGREDKTRKEEAKARRLRLGIEECGAIAEEALAKRFF